MHDQTAMRTEGIAEQFRLHPDVKAEVDEGYRGLANEFSEQVRAPPKKPKEDAPPTGVISYGSPSLRFVRYSHDLGLLLLADTHVHRDGVWSFAPTNNEPARLAKSTLLARQCGDQDLERTAVTKLRNRGEEPVAHRPDCLFRQAVADWSRRYGKATDIDLSDLAKLSGSAPNTPTSRSSARPLGAGR
ncbi:hypothetical protein [Streptomyces sp. ATCC 21386]|uniref:hypothetical protein n=1 Tax=Streptomyces sp. ATCC 21386 TaxID=2699428 RepID=UPI001BFF108D